MDRWGSPKLLGSVRSQYSGVFLGKHATSIIKVCLDNPAQISGNGLKHLASLRNLRTLDFSASRLNTTARNKLKPLTVVEQLSNIEIPPADTDNILRMFKTTDITF